MKRAYNIVNRRSWDDMIVTDLMNSNYQYILCQIAKHVAEITNCPVSFIYAWSGGRWHVIASYGWSFVTAREWSLPSQAKNDIGRTPYEIGDLTEHALFKTRRMVVGPPHLRYAIGAPLAGPTGRMIQDGFVALWGVDFEPRETDPSRLNALKSFGEIASLSVNLLLDLIAYERDALAAEKQSKQEHEEQSKQEHEEPFLKLADVASDVAANYDGEETRRLDIASEFLEGTLIKRDRMLRRGNHVYFAAKTWRKAVKDYQIAAVRQLKATPPPWFVDLIGRDLEGLVHNIHGAKPKGVVVPVPCGNSGPNCLSYQVARNLAERLNLPFCEAFAHLPKTGSSHPRKNATRPKMKLVQEIYEAVLLIDDIATSGAHIAEAASLLSKAADSVSSFAWIAE